MQIVGNQMESYVSGAYDCISLNSDIGDTTLISDNTSQGHAGVFTFLNSMQSIYWGLNAVGAKGITNYNGSSQVYSDSDGTFLFDPFQGYPQIRQGAFYVQSEDPGDLTIANNGYYTQNGWYYPNNGPSEYLQFSPANNGTISFATQPTNTVGNYSALFPVQFSIAGNGTVTVATNLTVNSNVSVLGTVKVTGATATNTLTAAGIAGTNNPTVLGPQITIRNPQVFGNTYTADFISIVTTASTSQTALATSGWYTGFNVGAGTNVFTTVYIKYQHGLSGNVVNDVYARSLGFNATFTNNVTAAIVGGNYTGDVWYGTGGNGTSLFSPTFTAGLTGWTNSVTPTNSTSTMWITEGHIEVSHLP